MKGSSLNGLDNSRMEKTVTVRAAVLETLVMLILAALLGTQPKRLHAEAMKARPSDAFPKTSGPIAITSGAKEHFFASYYGINSWSADQQYVTVLQTTIKYRLPTENDAATLGLVDLKTKEFIPLAQTRAWNFQQGCMAHWLGTVPNSRIIYNDLMNMKSEAVLPLGRYVHPPAFRKQGKSAQCDLHGRWSPKSDIIGFNSVTTGQRQVYIIRLDQGELGKTGLVQK